MAQTIDEILKAHGDWIDVDGMAPLWKAVGSITEPQVIEALQQRAESAERERIVFMEETESHTTRLQNELTILREKLAKMERVVNAAKYGPCRHAVSHLDCPVCEALAALSEKEGA